MFALIIAVVLVVSIVELTAFASISSSLGIANAIGLMILISMFGAWLARHEGFVTWRRINAAAARGEIPGDDMIDGFLILIAGLLMLTPGFVTDVFALTVLFPPTRSLYRRIARRRIRLDAIGVPPGGRRGPDDVIDV